jgi:hypothetical protein
MQLVTRIALGALFASMAACSAATRGTSATLTTDSEATLAQIYFWRARPGMLEEYNGYIRDVAEPIDDEAQRNGAFVSVTTYVTADSTLPWTHMRVFLLRDSVQLNGLGAALSAAGVKLQPDSTRRRVQGEYSATLRDRVGAVVTRIVK